MKISTINISSPDVRRLARFYADLLEYEIAVDEGDWTLLRDPAGTGIALAVQDEPHYTRPVWPAGPGDADMKLHLEIRVDDLDAAIAHAARCGAEVADFQPQADVRVCLDPDGHPFCLWTES